MDRPLKNLCAAALLGLTYGVLSGVRRYGFVTSVAVFLVLGLLYSAATQPLYHRVRASGKWSVRFLYSLGKALAIGSGPLGILGLAENNVGWGPLYALFDYAEPDPLGPAVFTMVFFAGLGSLSLLVDGVSAIRRLVGPASRGYQVRVGARTVTICPSTAP